MAAAAFFGGVAQVENPAVRDTKDGACAEQLGEAMGEFVADRDHLGPDLGYALRAGFVFLEQHDHAVDLFQLGLRLSHFAIQWFAVSGASQAVIELFDSRLFERVQISQFQCHGPKLTSGSGWVKWAGESSESWISASGDVRIGRSAHTREACRKGGLTVFFRKKRWMDIPLLEQHTKLSRCLPQIIESAKKGKPSPLFTFP